MKKTPIILSLIALAGCNANNKQTQSKDSVTVDTTTKYTMSDSAKMMLDSANFYMKKGITKELSQEAAREKVNPFMDRFQTIYSMLSPADTSVVYQYRIDGVNKLIDLQVEQTNKESK